MKRTILLALVLFTFWGVAAHANPPGCPQFATKLEEFKRCMVPMRGGDGAVYRGTRADVVGDNHSDLINAMHARPILPPQVVPGSYSIYGPMVAVAAAQARRSNPNSRFWLYYSMPLIGYPTLPYVPYYPW